MQLKLVKTYQGHTDCVNAIICTSISPYAISGSEDQTLKVWDLESDEALHQLKGHKGTPLALAAFPNSDFVVSGGDDCAVIIWNADSGEHIRRLQGHSAPVTAVAPSPDGKFVVSGSADQTLRIWDSLNGSLQYVCAGHVSAVETVAITPDSRYALAGETGFDNGDCRIKVWDLQTGKHIRDFPQVHHGINFIRVVNGGKNILTASIEGDIVLWDWQTGEIVRTIETHLGSMVMGLMSKARYAIAGTQKPLLALWDLEKGEQIAQLDKPADWVSELAITPDDHRVLVGCHDGTLHLYELSK